MSIRSSVGGLIVERSFDPKTVEDTRTMQFIISTEEKDRHGTRLNSENWHLENYAFNPIVMYQHQGYGDNPCIKSVPDDIIGKSVVGTDTYKGKRVLVGEPTFEPKELNETAEKVFRKLLFGSLRAASVGFIEVGKGSIESVKNAKGEIEKTYVFEGQELLEWSVVHIPSNAKSGARTFINQVEAQLEALERMLPMFGRADLRKMKVQEILDHLNTRFINPPLEELLQELEKPGADPNLNKYEERLLKIKK